MNRRTFLASAGALVIDPVFSSLLRAQAKALPGKPHPMTPAAATPAADHTLKIEPCTIDISPGVNIKTLAYNGQVPGPLLRLREGTAVTIDVINASQNA